MEENTNELYQKASDDSQTILDNKDNDFANEIFYQIINFINGLTTEVEYNNHKPFYNAILSFISFLKEKEVMGNVNIVSSKNKIKFVLMKKYQRK